VDKLVTTSRFVNNEKIDPAILGKIMGPGFAGLTPLHWLSDHLLLN